MEITVKDKFWLARMRGYARVRGYDLSYLSDAQMLEKKVVCELRGHLAFFGVDTTHLSNKEIQNRVLEFSRLMAQGSITTREAIEAMTTIGAALASPHLPASRLPE